MYMNKAWKNLNSLPKQLSNIAGAEQVLVHFFFFKFSWQKTCLTAYVCWTRLKSYLAGGEMYLSRMNGRHFFQVLHEGCQLKSVLLTAALMNILYPCVCIWTLSMYTYSTQKRYIIDLTNASLTFKSSCVIIVISINPWLRIFIAKLIISSSLVWVWEYCKCVAYCCAQQRKNTWCIKMLHNQQLVH